MSRTILYITVLVLGLSAVQAAAESVVMTSYLPSPAGIYMNLTVTSTTVLARDGGNVAIGADTAHAKLDVNGDTIIRGNVAINGKLQVAGITNKIAMPYLTLVVEPRGYISDNTFCPLFNTPGHVGTDMPVGSISLSHLDGDIQYYYNATGCHANGSWNCSALYDYCSAYSVKIWRLAAGSAYLLIP